MRTPSKDGELLCVPDLSWHRVHSEVSGLYEQLHYHVERQEQLPSLSLLHQPHAQQISLSFEYGPEDDLCVCVYE